MLVTQLSFCTVRHPISSVLTCSQPTVLTSTRFITAPGTCCRSLPSTNPRYGRTAAAACWHELNFSAAWWMMRLIRGEIDLEHVSMQTVVTLNTYCDIACLTFNATQQWALFTGTSVTQHNSPFQNHQCLEGNNIPSIRRVSSTVHKIVRWHFSAVMDKTTITATIRLFMVALCNRADHIYFHPVVCYGRPM